MFIEEIKITGRNATEVAGQTPTGLNLILVHVILGPDPAPAPTDAVLIAIATIWRIIIGHDNEVPLVPIITNAHEALLAEAEAVPVVAAVEEEAAEDDRLSKVSGKSDILNRPNQTLPA